MKFKLAHWEIVLFIFANLICAVSYILPILLIAGLFMLADLATIPGNSIRAFNFIYFLFTLVYLLGKNFVIWFAIFIICKFGCEKYKSIAQNFKTPTKIWVFILAITAIIDNNKDKEPKWYALTVFSGYENIAKQNLENTIFMQLYRNRTPSDKISYYYDSSECDFVLQRNDCVTQLIQVCWDITDQETFTREIKGLLEAASATNCDNMMIITNDEEKSVIINGKNIQIVPAWKWLLNDKQNY